MQPLYPSSRRVVPNTRRFLFALAALTAVALVLAPVGARAYWTTFTNTQEVKDLALEGDVLWAATRTGVLRCDKNTDDCVKFQATDGLASNSVNAVVVDSTNTKWFATRGGVSRFDDGGTAGKFDDQWTTFDEADGLGHYVTSTIVIDANGLKWFGTAGGVSRLDDGGTVDKSDDQWTTFTESDGVADNGVSAIAIDADGIKWFGTSTDGISRLDDGGTADKSDDQWTTFTEADGLSGDQVQVITIEPDGIKWFGTSYDGISRLDDGGTSDKSDDQWTTFADTDGLVDRRVLSIAIDAAGIKWFGTYEGISRLDDAGTADKSDDQWTNFAEVDGLLCRWVQAILIESGGIKCFGSGGSSYDGGINRLDDNGTADKSDDQWSTLGETVGLVHNNVMGMVIDANGIKWFVSQYGGISRLNDGGTADESDDQWTTFTEADGLLYEIVKAIAIEANGIKWFGTLYGISRLDDGGTADKSDDQWTTFTEADGLAYHYLRSIAIDGNGIKWFGTNHGVSRLDDAGTADKSDDQWTSFTETDGLTDDEVMAIAIDANGIKWFGTCIGGVNRLDDGGTADKSDDQWTTFSQDDGLIGREVWAIAIDTGGVKWFGAFDGLSRLDDGGTADKSDDQWTIYSEEDGLADSYSAVSSIAIDDDGVKWFGTSRGGVSRLDDGGTADKLDDQWTTFLEKDGLTGNQFTRSIWFGSAGDRWFASSSGVGWFIDNFLSTNATHLSDGNTEISWQVNPVVDAAVSANLYRSLSYEEGYQKLNHAPLPLTGNYLDENPAIGVTNYYWLELVINDGSTSRDKTDRIWIEPTAVDPDFIVKVRESTVASVPGDVSTYDVEVQSQKGYTGTVNLGVAGLSTEAVSAVFDPPSVDVPGRSTLTVEWDPLLNPPVGGYAYPFQITATEAGSLSLTTKTVDVMGVVIDPDDHYLTQFVYPAEPTAGNESAVFGRLTPNEAGQTVTVTTGTTLDVFMATTDDAGYFSLTVPVNSAGAIQFASSVAGASAAPYSTEVRRGRRRIRMTATTADGQFDPSDLVTIDGEIDPNPGAGEIYLEILNPGGGYASKGNISVDAGGNFHQSFYAQEGVTAVEAEFAGDADYYNASARLNVPVNAPIGMAIVVAAGGQTGNPLWNATGVLCDTAYNVYRGRLIPEDRIRYLHPDPTHIPAVAAAPTKAELQASIETWASGLVDVSTTYAPFKTPLTLYIVGVNISPGLIQLNETETLSSTELGGWLDTFLTNVQARYADPDDAPEAVPINVVLEFEKSGTFVADIADRKRIIASAAISPPSSESPTALAATGSYKLISRSR